MVIRALLLIALLAATPAATEPPTEVYTTDDHPAGETFEWTVPDGVSLVTIQAAAGNGARVDTKRTGGRGALVTVDIAVSPGQQFEVTLGANGQATGRGGAGYGTGGKGKVGGGGGGSTAVVFGDQVIALAGGGGGSSTGNGVRTGGGGNGGTPKGHKGDIAGGSGGSKGTGGIGVGPWGGPGGTGPHGGGGDVANEAGGGGGAGFGGGGAGGIGGDGGGGGSTGTEGATYSTRDDDYPGGWVGFTYTVASPTPAPSADPLPEQLPKRADLTPIGIGAAILAIGGVSLLIFGRRRSKHGGRRR
jgi:hypothetical protein